jgi:hypothetical protein
MLKEKFEIRDEYGAYLRVEQDAKGKVTLTLKATTEEENYFIENMELPADSVRKLIAALRQTLQARPNKDVQEIVVDSPELMIGAAQRRMPDCAVFVNDVKVGEIHSGICDFNLLLMPDDKLELRML